MQFRLQLVIRIGYPTWKSVSEYQKSVFKYHAFVVFSYFRTFVLSPLVFALSTSVLSYFPPSTFVLSPAFHFQLSYFPPSTFVLSSWPAFLHRDAQRSYFRTFHFPLSYFPLSTFMLSTFHLRTFVLSYFSAAFVASVRRM